MTAEPAVTITITGSGFAQGAAVILGSANLAVTFVNSTKLTAAGSVNPPVGGVVSLTVINPDPVSAGAKIPIMPVEK